VRDWQQTVRALRWWAELLDSRFRVPGTRVRFGIDPILSLIPGLGDLASPVFTLGLLLQAARQRVPKIVMVRMVINAGIDAGLGLIPIAGNVGDIFWRANTANLALLERHARPGQAPSAGDYAVVAIGIGIIVLFAFGALAITYLAARLVVEAIQARPPISRLP
jgi:hypothetical protein